MTRYFLTGIRLEGFRGVNNEGNPLDLRFATDKVNSVFAVNGTGKSSIFEALSFAIRGSIPKLDMLQEAEKPDEYYVNRFHVGGMATIDLEFSSDEATPALVKVVVQRAANGQRVVTSLSGHPDPESFLKSLSEAFSLLDYQSFTRFIDESPLNRGRSFSALLGLSQYSDFRQALRSAADTRILNSDLEIRAQEARIEGFNTASIAALTRMQHSYATLTGKSLDDSGRLSDYATEVRDALVGIPLLEGHARGTDLSDIDFDVLIDSIRSAEGGADRKELSLVIQGIESLKVLGDPDPHNSNSEGELRAQVAELARLLTGTRGQECRHVYEAAEVLIESGTWLDLHVCPLCESPLVRAIDQIVDEQLANYGAVSGQITAMNEALVTSSFWQRLKLLEQGDFLRLETEAPVATEYQVKVKEGKVVLEDLDSASRRLADLEGRLGERLVAAMNRKTELETALPPSLVKLTEQVEAARAFASAAKDHATASVSVAAANKRLVFCQRWASFITRVAASFAEGESGMASAKISVISDDYKAMFSKLMFTADVVPELRRDDQREDLHVQLSDFHGLKDLSARALLSESYRNALAMSVFLAAAALHKGPPRFIVLDDVTSSFDAGHQLNLMELVRTGLQNGTRADGLQFIILSHDGQLEKYFDRLDGEGDWKHQRLQGSPPMGAIVTQIQDGNRLRKSAMDLLSAGQVQEAQPLIRQYLEFKLMQVIRKVSIPVPIDFAMKDHQRIVSNCLEAITVATELNERAGTLILEPGQVASMRTTYVPAIIGNWVNHYETASGASISAPMLMSVIQAIDNFSDCFKRDAAQPDGSTRRDFYRSLSKK